MFSTKSFFDDLPEVTTHKRIEKLKHHNSNSYEMGLFSLLFIFFSFVSSAAFNLSGYTPQPVEADPLAYTLSWVICVLVLFMIIRFAIRGAEIEQHTLELEQQQKDFCELYRGYRRNASIAVVNDPNGNTCKGKIYTSISDDIQQIICK